MNYPHCLGCGSFDIKFNGTCNACKRVHATKPDVANSIRYEVRYIGENRMVLSAHRSVVAAVKAKRPRANSKIVAVGESDDLDAAGAHYTADDRLVMPGPDAANEWIECEVRS